MPIYEYQCQKCNEVSEVFLRSGEKAPKSCPTCGGRLQKIISHSGFQFKGTGWYVTDYARKGKVDPSSTGEKSPAATPSSSTKESGGESASKDKASPKK